MKVLAITALSLVLLASACAPQRTCPTYLKNTNKVESIKRV